MVASIMTPKTFHEKARNEIAEADEGCSIDVALIRFASRLLDFYDQMREEMGRDAGLDWRSVEDLYDYIKQPD